jgi:hypothetical protein
LTVEAVKLLKVKERGYMKRNAIASWLVLGAILITVIGTNTTKTLSQEPHATKSRMTFVCASEAEPPTTYGYIPGKVALEPVISWHSEYLLPGESASELCQQVAQKLQSKSEQQQNYYLAADRSNKDWKVCLVAQPGQECSAQNSEYLFSLNNKYQAPRCVMENIQPLQCPSSRGALVSLKGGSYTPSWWPF